MKLEVPSFGIRTEVHRWGPANPPGLNGIVALHGFTGTGLDFAPLAAETSSWPCEWAAPDLPGHGNCETVSDPGFSFAATDHLIHRALESLTSSRRFLLGYSMGGRLALHFALHHPQLIDGLILIGSSPGIEEDAAREERKHDDNHLARELAAGTIQDFMNRWEDLPILRSQQQIPASSRASMAARRRTQRPAELAQALMGLGTGTMPNLWPEIRHYKSPIELVTGAEDVKFLSIARAMAARNPRCRIIEIPEAGHTPHLENTPAFLTFLHRRLAQETPPGK